MAAERDDDRALVELVAWGRKPACEIRSSRRDLIALARRAGLQVARAYHDPLWSRVGLPVRVRDVVSERDVLCVGVRTSGSLRLYRALRDLALIDALNEISRILAAPPGSDIRGPYVNRGEGALGTELDVVEGLVFGYKPCCIRFFAAHRRAFFILTKGRRRILGRCITWPYRAIFLEHFLGGHPAPPIMCPSCARVPLGEYFGRQVLARRHSKFK